MITDLQEIQDAAKKENITITKLCNTAGMVVSAFYRKKEKPELLRVTELKNLNDALTKLTKKGKK